MVMSIALGTWLTVTSARLIEGWLTVISNTLVVDGNINQGLRLAVVD